MEKLFESLLLTTRWLLAPLYLFLLLVLALFAAKAAQELWHLVLHFSELRDTELILATLSLIDLALVGNLVLMVALSSYETFVSAIEIDTQAEKPLWLGKLEPGTVKVKVAASIVAISAIQLLKTFVNIGKYDPETIKWLVITHLTFLVSALALAWIDRIAFRKPQD